MRKKIAKPDGSCGVQNYDSILGDISYVIGTARSISARSVNSIITADYWLIGRRIVESVQKGEARAEYGKKLIERPLEDLSGRFGRGFGAVNLSQMKKFYMVWPTDRIFQTLSEKSEADCAKDRDRSLFHEAEAQRGWWSVCQIVVPLP